MKKSIAGMLPLLILLAPRLAQADGAIRFKPGEMSMAEYLEMASNAIPMVVSNAAEDLSKYRVQVPRLGELDRAHALAQVLSTLSSRGLTLVEDEQLHFQRLLRVRDARDSAIPLITDLAAAPDNDKLVTFAFPLKHAQVEGVARLLRSFAPPSARLVPIEHSRTLLISDSSRSVAKYRDLIARLDTPEAAKDAEQVLKDQRARSEDENCPSAGPASPFSQGPQLPVLVALFAIMGVVIGFMVRGYVIRRIEGGL